MIEHNKENTMTARELLEVLKELDEKHLDDECLLGIDRSCGFADHDHINVYPIERVISRPIRGKFITSDGKVADHTRLEGYWYDLDNDNKILLYVFP